MPSRTVRLAAGAAALMVAASVGASISSPALAAGPDLEISYDSGGEVDNSGRLVGVELPEVNCGTEGEFPAKASGYQGVKAKMKLRIISTPGDDGTLRVWSDPKSAEANPANDEVTLVVTVGGSDGSGGGLPVTGTNVALLGGIGGGVVAIGAALFFLARRRRIVIVNE
jgi:LPXTG-motif cell wall-anchored protein